jgi:hypothetical protein
VSSRPESQPPGESAARRASQYEPRTGGSKQLNKNAVRAATGFWPTGSRMIEVPQTEPRAGGRCRSGWSSTAVLRRLWT